MAGGQGEEKGIKRSKIHHAHVPDYNECNHYVLQMCTNEKLNKKLPKNKIIIKTDWENICNKYIWFIWMDGKARLHIDWEFLEQIHYKNKKPKGKKILFVSSIWSPSTE